MCNGTRESIIVIREELLKHGELYDGFLASIVSALNEARPYMGEKKLAELILGRIVGVVRIDEHRKKRMAQTLS